MSEKAVPRFKVSVRHLMLAAMSAMVVVYAADDITIPLEGGNLVIRPQFIRVNGLARSYVPELSFKIKNETPMPWNTLKLQFDIGGFCNGEPRQWSLSPGFGRHRPRERRSPLHRYPTIPPCGIMSPSDGTVERHARSA